MLVDLDGVIAFEGEQKVYGDRHGWRYELCKLVPGAVAGLARLHERFLITLYTARKLCDYDVTLRWLRDHGIVHGTHYDALDVGTKPRAVLYVDDRGFRFRSWGSADLDDMLAHAIEAEQQELAHDTEAR